MKKTESWVDIFPGVIPHQRYDVQLEMGEENGLIVNLLSSQFHVKIDFGLVRATNILDEGIELNESQSDEDDNSLHYFREEGFPSTIYQILDGAYLRYVKDILGESLFSFYDLRQYSIITRNFVIMVITQEAPTITVHQLE